MNHICNRSLLIMLAVLSCQGQVWTQSALAQSLPEPPAARLEVESDQAFKQPSEAKTKSAANPLKEQASDMSPGPEAQKSWADDDDGGIFCCIAEILLLAGLVLIGVLGANLIMWLIKQNPRY